MRVVYRCTHAKLPGGLRLVQKACRRAGFTGTIVVKCNGEDKASQAELKNGKFLAGNFLGGTILLYRNTSHSPTFGTPTGFSANQREPREAFRTLLHELGHSIRNKRGRLVSADEYALNPSPEERSANRYANKEVEILWTK